MKIDMKKVKEYMNKSFGFITMLTFPLMFGIIIGIIMGLAISDC